MKIALQLMFSIVSCDTALIFYTSAINLRYRILMNLSMITDAESPI